MNLTETALNTSVILSEGNPKWGMWKGSPFESFYLCSSKAKGSKGERLIAEVMEQLGHRILRDKKGKLRRLDGNSDHDIVVDGHTVEVKTSLTWGSDRDMFTWQQIRSMQNYERIIFIGLNPDEMKVFWATKKDLKDNIFDRDEYRQHGGKNGDQELYWIKNHVPSWFKSLEEW
jgi:hypothetical protein